MSCKCYFLTHPYLTYGTDAANMLFHVVNDRHRRRRSMIFTTNKPTSAWGRVLHDDDLAQAIVDRILERGRILTLDGPSMRTQHLGLDDSTAEASNHADDNLARISGITRPEFPEPALVGYVPGPRCRVPLLHPHYQVSQLLRTRPSLRPASVLCSSWVVHLEVSLNIGATGSHVPHKSLHWAHAVWVPVTTRAVSRPPRELVPGQQLEPGFDDVSVLSTR